LGTRGHDEHQHRGWQALALGRSRPVGTLKSFCDAAAGLVRKFHPALRHIEQKGALVRGPRLLRLTDTVPGVAAKFLELRTFVRQNS